MSAMRISRLSETEKLLHLIECSTSPFHAVREAMRQLEEAGYEPLDMKAGWDLVPGGKYFVSLYDSSLAAFRINPEFREGDMLRISASHTDWPCLRLKPVPESQQGSYRRLSVECYGGLIQNTWLDRPLSLAGRVALRGEDAMHPEMRLVDYRRPVCTIPNLAIHMNREVNKGVELNRENEMQPLLGTGEPMDEPYFTRMLARELDVAPEDILWYEISVYNSDPGDVIGIEEDLISAPRLDNLTSVQASLSGLLSSEREDGIDAAFFFDNEEIGSATKQGAASSILPFILEKIYLALGLGREAFLGALSGCLLLSMDVGHAIHPNRPELYSRTNGIELNQGFVLKTAASQSYATDGETLAIIRALAAEREIPYRIFASRADKPSGRTLGSMASALLAARTVDVGVPILAMHSARELMGARDQQALCDLAQAFYAM